MGDIQRKLKLIDAQLTGSSDLHSRVFRTCPLLLLALGLTLGITIQTTAALSIYPWLIILIACAAAIVNLLSRNGLQTTIWKFASIAMISFICLGAIRLQTYQQITQNDISNFVTSEPKLATIQGRLATDPYTNEKPQWKFARFTHSDPYSSFYLKLNQAKTTQGWKKITGIIRIHVAEPVLDLKTGDHIQLHCQLNRFKNATNPGQFDMQKHMAGRNIFVAASVRSRNAIELLQDGSTRLFSKLKWKLRHLTTQALIGSSAENQNQGLLQALLLGFRSNVTNDVHQAFQKTGLLHFISLSGLHLGILFASIWWICKTAGLLKPARAIVSMIVIAIFLLIVPPRAPTIRAAIICWTYCISFLFRRRSNPINTLSLAAIILLLIRPTMLFEPGWQLSFAAVLGILFFAKRIQLFLDEHLESLFAKIRKKNDLLWRFIAGLSGMFSVGLAAWIGSAGILLYHFYTINLLTCLWTIIVFPFVTAILMVGYLKIILTPILPTASILLATAADLLCTALIATVKFIANLASGQILIGNVPLPVPFFYYTIIAFIALANPKRIPIKKLIYLSAVLALISFLSFTKYQRTHRDNLSIHCLDVGHGQAILTQLPGNANILFDAGSLHKTNIGLRVITPFLRYSGIDKIDAIVISHNDTDHINAIPELTDNCRIGAIYANDAFFNKNDKWGTAEFLRDQLSEKGFTIQRLPRELNLNSRAKIKILWPRKQDKQTEHLSDNDTSTVSLIEFAGQGILLCSDIEKFSQNQITTLYSDLKPEIIIIPHHGSFNTLDPDFLKKLEPEILICSCGKRQYEKAPLLESLSDGTWLYTQRDGAINIEIDKTGQIKTHTFTNKQKPHNEFHH